MKQELIIQAGEEEVQIAVMEEGRIVELFFGDSIKEGFSGNIYLGRVENVLPGMQSAFIDIGLNKNAFLYVEEAALPSARSNNGEHMISEYVRKGQELLVQVIKEPVRQKGSRVSRHITLPGRYLVLMPLNDHLGISRKIEDPDSVQRLRDIMEELKPEGMGIIVRTVAEKASEKCLREDLEMLLELWDKIQREAEKLRPPALIHNGKPVLEKIMRDILNHKVERVIVNDDNTFEKLKNFRSDSQYSFLLELVPEKDLFSLFGIKNEIRGALARKVWLDNGSYIVFDETEALTSVDVNTGKYIGKSNFEETILETNLEAIKEIVRQIRLRNIGGIIIIDFIDMQSKEKKDFLVEELNRELRKDRIKSHIFGITHLGLVEMTRKKVGSALSSAYERKCQNCEGRGKVTSERMVFALIKEDLKSMVRNDNYGTVIVRVPSPMYRYLLNHNAKIIKSIEEKMGIIIVIAEEYDFRDDQYEVEGIR